MSVGDPFGRVQVDTYRDGGRRSMGVWVRGDAVGTGRRRSRSVVADASVFCWRTAGALGWRTRCAGGTECPGTRSLSARWT